MVRPKVLVIVGPTASGKSDLAVRLAKRFDGEIISADSRQVYKGLDIGTGKITKREMRGIPHYLLDVANPKKQFSVAQYKSLADKFIRLIVEKDRLPIVVGGAGFYIDTLTGTAIFPDVPPNKKLRKRFEKKSVEELFKILKEKDRKRAQTIDPYNKMRLIRALEIVNTIGHVPVLTPSVNRNHFIYIGLKPVDLDKRIYKRLLARLDGIIREAKKLIKLKAISYKRMHELGLEYRYVALHLQGKLSREEMIEKLYIEIKRYAKRQMTWFKRNHKIKWFTLSTVEGFRPEEYKRIERYVRIAL